MFLNSFLSAINILADLGHKTKMPAAPIYGKNPLKKLLLQTQWADVNEILYVASKMRAHYSLFKLLPLLYLDLFCAIVK